MPIISRNENTRSGVASPNLRQQFRHGFDVGHAGRAGADEHPGAVQPGLGIVGIAPPGFGLGDQLEPIREHFRRRELARHVGVIQMAVGIDQAGH